MNNPLLGIRWKRAIWNKIHNHPGVATDATRIIASRHLANLLLQFLYIAVIRTNHSD